MYFIYFNLLEVNRGSELGNKALHLFNLIKLILNLLFNYSKFAQNKFFRDVILFKLSKQNAFECNTEL